MPNGSVSPRAILLFVGAFLVLGCGRVQRAQQCERLAQTVNPRLDTIERLTSGEQSPADLRAIANEYEAIANSLAPLEFSKKALAAAVTDYGKNLKIAAREARKAADAKQNASREEHVTARREIGALTRPLSLARTRIDNECR